MLFFCHRLLNCLHLPVPSNHRGRCRQGRQTPCHDRRYSHAPLISQEGIARMNNDPTKPNFVISPWLTPRPASSKLTRVHVQSLIHDKKKGGDLHEHAMHSHSSLLIWNTAPITKKRKKARKETMLSATEQLCGELHFPRPLNSRSCGVFTVVALLLKQ
ncbi:hypothetical protein VTI28DRAFT_10231 [Corynascus sepedonium]